MVGYSLYEKDSPFRKSMRWGLACGNVVSVDPDNRSCVVRTFDGTEFCDNCVFENTQWLSMDSTAEGDETAAMPRVGNLVLIAIVNSNAYILGGFRPLNEEGGFTYGNEVKLKTGDKIIKTKAENRITVRSNKLIEVIAKEGALQTVYFPNDNTIAHLCSNHQMILRGGRTEWLYDADLKTALKKELARRDLFQSMVVTEEKGYVDALLVYRKAIGTLPPGVVDIPLPIYSESVDMFGTRKVQIQPPVGVGGIEIEYNGIGPLYSIKMGLVPQFKLDINALLGTVDLDVNKVIQASLSGVDGTFKINNVVASMEVSGVGDITVKNPTVTVSAATTGDVEIKNPTVTATLSKTGDIGLKNPLIETKFGVDGSTTIENSSAYKIAASPAGEISVSNVAKAGLKMSPGGQVALGGAAAELLDLFDKTFDALDEIIQNLSSETHIGNMGIPTVPDPSFKSKYISGQAKLKALKAQLGSIKGSL